MKKIHALQKCFSAEKIAAFLNPNWIWLIVWLIFGAVVSGYNKFDFLWDFENYHLYNPWKALDSAGYQVYTPLGAINSFFNPMPDMPLYLLIKHFNDYPTLIYAIQGLWFGALLFIFHKTVLLFFDKKTYRDIICTILAMAIGITGQATWFQAGSSTNEVQIAFFVILGMYYMFKMQKYPHKQSIKGFFLSGLILGIALGLKQTSLPYSFGAGIAMLVFYKNLQRPIPFIGAFILGGFISSIVLYGPTMYANYMEYGNPIMPFMNGLFQSPYYGTNSFQDRRYIPNLDEFLYYPFVWEGRAAEIVFHDWRGKIFYGLVLCTLAYALIYYIIKRKPIPFFQSILNSYICVYMLVAYILWSLLFSIFRYLIPMELLFAIYMVYAMNKFIFRMYKFKWLLIVQIAVFELLMFEFLSVPTHWNWGTLKFERSEQYLFMERVTLPPNTLVKFYNLPTGILAPLLARNNPKFKVVAYIDEGFGMKIDFTERHKFKEIRDNVVANHKGPVVIFGVGDITAELLRKSNLKHTNPNTTVDDYYQIDRNRAFSRQMHFRRVMRRYHAGDHRLSVDIDSVTRFATEPLDINKSYKPNNEELFGMFCRRLRTNFYNKRYVICMPEEWKDLMTNPAFNQQIDPE